MTNTTVKNSQLSLLLLTLFVLSASFYFQYVQGLQPCPLCLMQRLCVFLLLLPTGLCLILRKTTYLNVIQFFVSCSGLYFSLRQLWLQSLPEGLAPSCMPSLEVLIQYFSWQTVAHALFLGSGDCAEVNWHLFGISMPAWSGLYFLLMACASLYFVTQRSR